jgi:polyisoprenoid-binding protein YceI
MSQGSDDRRASAQADVAALLADDAAVGRWVLDPAESRVEFHVKHFWGVITVHGSFGQITGEGNLGPDGALTGRLSIDTASLGTKNKKRDQHLRSAEFFDVEHHPHAVVTVSAAKPTGLATLTCRGTLETAGHVQPIEFSTHVEEASAQAVTLRAELVIDRTVFAMTWSPLGMASKMARTTIVARFVRP